MRAWSRFVSLLPKFPGPAHKVARTMAVLLAAEPQQPAAPPGRVAVLAEKLDQMLAATLERGEQIDVRAQGGVGRIIVVTDQREQRQMEQTLIAERTGAAQGATPAPV